MKANELRIGNLVVFSDDQTLFTVGEIQETGLVVQNQDETTWIELVEFEPIPITEEWLKRMGFDLRFDFDKDYGIYYKKLREDTEDMLTMRPYYMGGFLWGHSENPEEFPIEMGSPIGIEFVHQLQNLFFALTGEELTTNSHA